ncbi:eukaryotic translation initiation factor 2-alpha kinase 3-like [Scomber scombrus]|uniref:Eukaryotic translation initiation factor 2-alpha kinase 3-like n=1 Tax=Scomber scombrus TaxID=13677 RepID=A0AAV1MYZ3_SCOSC
MGKKKNYISELNEHAAKTQCEVKYEDIIYEGQDRTERFFQRAVVDGKGFPIGEGRNKKAARQNAAKNALRALNNKENPGPVAKNATKDPAAPVHPKYITKLNFEINDSGQQKRVPLKPVKPNNLRQNGAAPFVACHNEYKAAFGKTKTKTKEIEAWLLDQKCSRTEVPIGSAVPGDGAPAGSSKPPNRLTAANVQKEGQNSSEDELIPEEKDFGNSPSDKTSVQSEIISKFTAEFDSIECLDKGAFGHVYKAKKKIPKRPYAIKIVPNKKGAEQEVEALSDLNHDNIIRYYTCWVEDTGCPWDGTEDSCSTSLSSDNPPTKFLYIQMELCVKTLRVWIDERNTRNVKKSLQDFKRREDSLTLALQILSGVEYIHSNNLIHRDLKPTNIMFGQDGKIKIGDFGLVTAEKDEGVGNCIDRTLYRGTPLYMAPEQKSEQSYDRKVDIFPLGLIILELHWRICTVHEREVILGNARKQNLPHGFHHSFPQERDIIKSMLCVNPEDRPEASKLKEDLEELIHRLNRKEIMRHGSRTV